MMTDTALQQATDMNGQTLVTQSERQALIQKLTAKWTLELSTRVENLAYEKSRGVKPNYFKFVQNYYQQVQNAYQNRANQQQQQQQPGLQLPNNNGQFLNQQINHPRQPSGPMISVPPHQLNPMLNQQPRFPSVPQSLPPRITNPQPSLINPQSGVPNQVVRLREPQKFNQSLNSTPSVQTIDSSQSYLSQSQQQQMTNSNLNDYSSPSSTLQNRYPIQPSNNPRARTTTNLNGNFSQQSSTNNSNDILHHFVVGNPPTNSITSSPMTNPPVSGDRLLQQILLSNNDGTSNKMPIQNRQSGPTILSQQIRSSTATTNSNLSNSINPLRTSQQPSPSSSVIVMPTSNVQIQPSTNVTIQQSPLNNSNGPYSVNTQVIPQPMNGSTPLNNTNNPSPLNRSLPLSGSGSILSPDEETINLLKYFKENIGKIQLLCQKFTNEGILDKARNAQTIHQQMVQFINNPTYESLSNAKHIRDILERATNRPQPSNPPASQINDINQFEKSLTEYLSRDQKKRIAVNHLFIEPLSDVINGVPHKKVRLNSDNISNHATRQKICSLNESSLLSQLKDELDLLPTEIFSIEGLAVAHAIKHNQLNDDYLSKNGIVLRCKLLEVSNPLIQPLRLRVSTRYPEDQPEILSLTKTMPPKLEFSNGHPFFEQISTLFVAYLFKLPPQHTVTDILNIWRQSVQAAL